MSMQDALQLREQSLQSTHFDLSITIRKSEKREKKPSTVPTGHIVLQYVLPLRQASIANATSVTPATINIPYPLVQYSTL